MAAKEVKVPDIGGGDAVDVIEICVAPGDDVAAEDTLIILESDKATIEVPAPFSGKIEKLLVAVGQSVKEGDSIAMVATAGGENEPAKKVEQKPEEQEAAQPQTLASSKAAAPSQAAAPKPAASQAGAIKTICVPDIGSSEAIEVIEVNVMEGDTLAAESTMIVLESDKATMEVPCPEAGLVRNVLVKVGDKVSEGSPVIDLEVTSASPQPSASPSESSHSAVASASKPSGSKPVAESAPASAAPKPSASVASAKVHAGPAVRRLAHELGVNLAEVKATGPRDRILKEDVHGYVNRRLTGKGEKVAGGSGLPELPEIDFSKFGEIEEQALSKINKVSASNLHRAWVHIPHVTQFDEADITELESFRKSEGAALKDEGVRLTLLAFMIKACVKALKAFPKFNASLSKDGTNLILKKYYHIGIAVDTPNGLIVPVVKNADTKSVRDIALELQSISAKARDKKLSPADMQGGCLSISSLGGIGGTAFTPIVNWPEVAILGVSRSEIKPKFIDGEFKPRLMLPLSLSYDHRVIDGADAARFTTFLSQQLEDVRRLLL